MRRWRRHRVGRPLTRPAVGIARPTPVFVGAPATLSPQERGEGLGPAFAHSHTHDRVAPHATRAVELRRVADHFPSLRSCGERVAGALTNTRGGQATPTAGRVRGR